MTTPGGRPAGGRRGNGRPRPLQVVATPLSATRRRLSERR